MNAQPPGDAPPPYLSRSTPPGGGWVPVPDPTTLTTEQLRRELNGLREYLELQIAALKELTARRLDDSDKALDAALEATQRAIEKAEISSDKRFEVASAARDELRKQAGDFLTRRESEARQHAQDVLIAELQRLLAVADSKYLSRESSAAQFELVRDQNALHETRIRSLESDRDARRGEFIATDESRQHAQRELNNRVLIVGVAISVIVIVVNVVIALITHHA